MGLLSIEEVSQLSIYEMLQQTVKKYPNQTAVIDGKIELSYTHVKKKLMLLLQFYMKRVSKKETGSV